MRKLLQMQMMLVAVAMVLAVARFVYVDFIKESKIIDECDLLPAASTQLVEEQEEMRKTSKRYASLLKSEAQGEEIDNAEKAYADAFGRYTWTAVRVEMGIHRCYTNTMDSLEDMSCKPDRHESSSRGCEIDLVYDLEGRKWVQTPASAPFVIEL